MVSSELQAWWTAPANGSAPASFVLVCTTLLGACVNRTCPTPYFLLSSGLMCLARRGAVRSRHQANSRREKTRRREWRTHLPLRTSNSCIVMSSFAVIKYSPRSSNESEVKDWPFSLCPRYTLAGRKEFCACHVMVMSYTSRVTAERTARRDPHHEFWCERDFWSHRF